MTARTSENQLNQGSSEEPQENTAVSNGPAGSSPVHTLTAPSAVHSPPLSQLSGGTWKMQETTALAPAQLGACPVSMGGEKHKWERDGDEQHCPSETDIDRYFLPCEVSALSSQSVQDIYSQMFAERAPLTCTGRKTRSLYTATCWSCPLRSVQKRGDSCHSPAYSSPISCSTMLPVSHSLFFTSKIRFST